MLLFEPTWMYQIRILVGPDICYRGCANAVFHTVRRPGVYSAVYATVHYTEPLKSFEIRVELSPGLGLPSVTILPQYAENDDILQYTYI